VLSFYSPTSATKRFRLYKTTARLSDAAWAWGPHNASEVCPGRGMERSKAYPVADAA
jgi:hypothetical protein